MSVAAPGLSVRRFFEALGDDDVRRFIDPGVLRVLDAIFGGRVAGEDLRRVALTLVDLAVVMADGAGRRLVLEHLPDAKRAEFESRVQRSSDSSAADEWTSVEVDRALDFFGLVEERLRPPVAPAMSMIAPAFALFDHQREAVRRLFPLLEEDDRRVLLHLPTGVGKTRTAMHVVAAVLRSNEPSVVVWLASGRELLEQAVATFAEAWQHLGTRPVQLGTMWGDRTPDLEAISDGFLAVGLAKAWSAMSSSDPEWATRLSARVRLVVFDEAHQSVARTYRRITDELTLDYRCALLGLTATPGRTWADIDKDGELAEFFGGNKIGLQVPGPNPIAFLIERGFLARPTFRTLFAEPGIKLTPNELRRIAGALDIPDDIVAHLSMSEQYVTAVMGAIEQLLEERHGRVLVFAATVDHARVITAILAARGTRAAVVTGETPTRLRDQGIRRFKSADPQPMVLVNFGVLTTGFDAPQASAVVIARPTQSLVLYSQMVGRAIRGPKAGGTESCVVVTVVDPILPGFGDVAGAFLNWEDVWA